MLFILKKGSVYLRVRVYSKWLGSFTSLPVIAAEEKHYTVMFSLR